MSKFKEDSMYNAFHFEENMTVSQLHDVLGKLIELGKGGYKITTDAYCCGTNGVELCDERREADIC